MSRWTQKWLRMKEAVRREEAQEDLTTEKKVRGMWCESYLTAVVAFQDGRRGRWAKECGQPLKVGKVKEMDSSLAFPEGMQPSQHLDLNPVRSTLVSNLQKGKWKSLSCVWLFEILQARILEWVAIPFSGGSSQHRDETQVSHIAGGFCTSWATRQAQSTEL